MSDQSLEPEPEPELEEALDPITFFSPEIHHAVTGMIYLGKYEKTINFIGHKFILQTIRPHLKFAIGQAMQEYRNTIIEPQVWAAMHVGVALVSIDNNSQFCPPSGSDEVEYVRQRFNYVTNETGWWQPTIDYLFAEYTAMEIITNQAIQELQDLALAGKVISSPLPGYLTAMGLSDEEMDEDGQPLVNFNMNS